MRRHENYLSVEYWYLVPLDRWNDGSKARWIEGTISLSVEIWYLVPWMCGTSGTTSIRVTCIFDDKRSQGMVWFKTRMCFKHYILVLKNCMQCWYQVPCNAGTKYHAMLVPSTTYHLSPCLNLLSPFHSLNII